MSHYERFYEIDEWTNKGDKILSEENLDAVRHHLESVGAIVIEHWHYRGSRAPTRLAFDEFEDFHTYLKTETVPGDLIYVYPFPDATEIAKGKCEDDQGRVPKKRAY